ncbi:GNAT family N-acetyltransferase [Gottfriedia luciferensis]|uniref:GNAT family N-acetyltransferase n=1 Tax=Gottfriedia luciferensis TaxID=178774 RepID=UPI000B439A90|nr:GNAT family protein [Gottfriedia luciferensis]
MKLVGNNVYLRLLEAVDAGEVLEYEVRNRVFFKPFTYIKEESYYTIEAQQERIRNNKEKSENDLYYGFGIFLKETDALIGNIMLSEVLRGDLQSCFVGYSLDEQQNGKGYTTEAVKLIVEFAFNELKLHRIEAGVMPHNIGSIRVLEKAGFHKEGIAKKNVRINGKWEDHQVLAIINENE